MKEQTRIRLAIINKRYGPRLEHAAQEAESREEERRAAFAVAFERLREEVLRPAMGEIGAELVAAGHGYRVEIDAAPSTPSIDLLVLLRGGRAGAANMIRLFVMGAEIIAEVAVISSPMELTRFQEPEALNAEVAEHMFVEAIEQIFAGNA